MFYSVDLLSLRKREGKLANIWLAATLNEQLFQKTVPPRHIRMITIYAICEEIMKIVDSRDQQPSGRFSLYLSSQLLYGVTKVFQKQVILFIKDLESVKKEIVQFKMQELVRFRSSDALKLLELPDVPSPSFPPLREDAHLLPEAQEPELTTLQCLMDDFGADLNFGALTDQEIQEFYGPDSAEAEDIFARKHLSDPGNIEIPLETSDPLPGIENTYNISTPTKRELAKQSGTPSKRRRLTYEEDTVIKEAHTAKADDIVTPMEIDIISKDVLSVHTATVPNISDLPPPDISEDVSSRLPEETVPHTDSLQLESLEMDEAFSVTHRKKHRGLLIDFRIRLKESVCAKWVSNVRFETQALKEACIDLHSLHKIYNSAKLFQLPSRMVQNVRGKTRCKEFWHDFYNTIIMGSLQKKVNGAYHETRSMEVPRAQDTISHEQETTNKSKDIITEHSKKEMTADITDPSKIIEKSYALEDDHRMAEFEDLQDIDIPTDSVNINLTDASAGAKTLEKEIEETVAASAVDFVTPEQEKEFLRNNEERKISNEKESFVSSISGSSASTANGKAQWTRQDFLAILEIHWRDAELVNFIDVIQPEANDLTDAVICFEFTLEFVRDGKVILHQEDANSPLYIQKKK